MACKYYLEITCMNMVTIFKTYTCKNTHMYRFSAIFYVIQAFTDIEDKGDTCLSCLQGRVLDLFILFYA